MLNLMYNLNQDHLLRIRMTRNHRRSKALSIRRRCEADVMTYSHIRLKKGEDRRIRAGHPWIFSNEIDTAVTPLKSFSPGQEVLVEAHDKTLLGMAYVNPHSLISARIYSRQPEQALDLPFLVSKLTTALQLRDELFSIPFYRLVFSEADGLP